MLPENDPLTTLFGPLKVGPIHIKSARQSKPEAKTQAPIHHSEPTPAIEPSKHTFKALANGAIQKLKGLF